MIGFFAEHGGTIVVALIVAAIVCGISAKLIRDRRKGKCVGCDCSGGCPSCPDKGEQA